MVHVHLCTYNSTRVHHPRPSAAASRSPDCASKPAAVSAVSQRIMLRFARSSRRDAASPGSAAVHSTSAMASWHPSSCTRKSRSRSESGGHSPPDPTARAVGNRVCMRGWSMLRSPNASSGRCWYLQKKLKCHGKKYQARRFPISSWSTPRAHRQRRGAHASDAGSDDTR